MYECPGREQGRFWIIVTLMLSYLYRAVTPQTFLNRIATPEYFGCNPQHAGGWLDCGIKCRTFNLLRPVLGTVSTSITTACYCRTKPLWGYFVWELRQFQPHVIAVPKRQIIIRSTFYNSILWTTSNILNTQINKNGEKRFTKHQVKN